MKKVWVVLISVSGIIWISVPVLAQSPNEEEVLYSTDRTADNLTEVVPCDARSHPILYYVPVEEMQCEVPGGYGIDFEGTLELEEKNANTQEEDRLSIIN
ncbi:MAG: hypothetical protein SW833_24930 [Cyanobacteriota bacterium]|nr:hypothetical protein [Cyanobacteriota bacterium]